MATGTNGGLDAAAQHIDLHGLEQRTRESEGLIQDSIAKIKSWGTDMANSVDAMVTAAMHQTDQNGETPESLAVKSAAGLEAQKRKSELLVSLGEDSEASSRLSNQLAAQFATTTREAAALAANISRRKSVGFFDNPLEFIWNQLQLPDEENALNAKVTEATFAKAQIDSINRMETETARNAEEYSQKLSAAGEASKIEGLKNNFIIKSEQLKQQGIRDNIYGVNAVMAANKQELDNYHQIIAVRNQQEQLRLAQNADSRAATAASQATEHFEQWKKDTKDTEEGRNQQLEWINKGAEIAGKPQLDQRQLLTLLKTTKGQLPVELNMMMERGYTAMATGDVSFGSTTTGAFEFAAATKTPMPNWLSEQMGAVTSRIKEEAKLKGVTLKDGPELQNQVNTEIRKAMELKLKSVDSRDETNPYLIPTTSVIAKNKAVMATPLFNKVLAPQAVDTRDINIIMARGLDAVKAGQISFQDLEAGLDTYLKAGVALNNVNNQFDRYKIAPATEYNYTTKVRTPTTLYGNAEGKNIISVFSGPENKPVNLLDSGERRQYLIQRFHNAFGSTAGY